MGAQHWLVDHIVPVTVAMAALVTALSILGRRVVRLWRWWHALARQGNKFLDDWYGEDNAHGTIPERLRRIEIELHANGGSTVRDTVDRIEAKLAELGEYDKWQDEQRAALWGLVASLHSETHETGVDDG